MPSISEVRALRGSANRYLVPFASILFAAALAVAAGTKPADAGGKWIGPAIAGAVIGGVIAHHAHRNYRHHGRYYYHHPRKHVRHRGPYYYHRPYYRHYGAPYIALRAPGFGLYIGR